MMNEIKMKAFNLACRLIKIPDGCLAPGWLTWLFFPLQKYCMEFAGIQYDFYHDIFKIYGVNYSGVIFRSFGIQGLQVGAVVKIVNRADGVLTLERVEAENKKNIIKSDKYG